MKKGLTLVEVLVSISVFAIAFATCLSIYFVVIKQETRQKEYLAFENVCLEIDKYSDVYGKEWNSYYFGNENNVQYYNEHYELLTGSFSIDKIVYELSFYYIANDENINELIVNIFEKETERYIIKDLNFGGARYV